MKRFIIIINFLLFYSFVFAQVTEMSILIDFGPNDVTNGNITISPDSNGSYWNNVIQGATDSVSGPFVDIDNKLTGMSLTMTSVMFLNGIQNGGLLDPNSSLLGKFAVPTATQDYFYKDAPNGPGGFKFSGLDQSKEYVFSFFATRNSTQERITQYDLQGSNLVNLTLQTSGTDLGGTGYHGNNSTIAVSDPVVPDENGEISVTVSIVSGGFCYVGLMQVEVVQPKMPFESLLVDFGPNDVVNGNITESPDITGNYWNNVNGTTIGSDPVFFVDTENNPVGVYLSIVSPFDANGIQNGGLLEPDSLLLGDFAIPTATQDYFYKYLDAIGTVKLSGLDVSKAYMFSFFATRNSTEERTTKYMIQGSTADSTTLQTSGIDLGGPGYNGNNSTTATTSPVLPDENGEITISVTRASGSFSYIGIMKVDEVIPTLLTYKGIFIDFGPNDVTNGNITSNPDTYGKYWNNVTEGTVNSVTGPFVDNLNNETGISLTITSVMFSNGILNGGLLEPDSMLLDDFAVATATQDYFYKDAPNGPGGFKFSGLDKTKQYVFSFFATRNSTQERITQYDLQGNNSVNLTLQTSGTDLGGTGYHGNNSTVAVSDPVVPDENGEISVTVSIISGGFCYVGIIKVEEQDLAEKLVLENTGFEKGNLSSWSVDPLGNLASAIVVTDNVRAGQYSLKLFGNSVDVSQSILCDADTDYLLSGFVFVSSDNPLLSGQSASIKLNYYDENNIFISGMESAAITMASIQDEWYKISAIATTPLNAMFIEATISWIGLTGQTGGAVYFDDLELEVYDTVVSPCTAYPQVLEELENSTFMEPDFDDQNWSLIHLPADSNNILHDNHTYWFRKTVDVSPDFAAESLFAVQLLDIDASIAVWINGVLVGESDFSKTGRTYTVSDSLILSGENLIVIHAGFLKGSSHFNDASVMKLFTPDKNMSITGSWRFHQGIIFTNENIIHDDNKIAIMGSSVALGQGATNQNGYAAWYSSLLQTRFKNGVGADWEISNISVGGNTTVDVLNRFEDDLLPQCAKYVVYGLSLGNEGVHEQGQAAFDQFRDNMQVLIQKARDYGIVPVVVNCYTRSDFNAADYEYIKQMNLLIHTWDVPSVNVLGAVDDGSGRWVSGYYADGWHPNNLGHLEMFYTFVPSLFDALDEEKPMPQKVEGTFYTIEDAGTISPFEYEVDEVVHPFTISFDINTNYAGAIAGFSDLSGTGLIQIDSLSGNITYTSPGGNDITSTVSVMDNNWHKITLSHYYARSATFLYVDTIQVGEVDERLTIQKFVLGGSGFIENITSPQKADYRNWLFYRSALNEDEVNALYNGKLLVSSLELYAPLDEAGITGNNPFVNLAQSTTTITQNIVDGIDTDNEAVPLKFGLFNNYPNPFNPSTTIKYTIAKTSNVKLYIYNILGKEVALLVNKNQNPGYYKVSFDGNRLSTGIYFYTLLAGGFRQTKKMVYIK